MNFKLRAYGIYQSKVTSPEEGYRTQVQVVYDQYTLAEKAGTFEKDMDILNRFARAFASFPEVGYLMGQRETLPAWYEERVGRYPELVLYSLQSDYNRYSERFESLLYPSGEMIYRLLSWAKQKGQTLRHPLNYYESQLDKDPYWASQWYSRNGATGWQKKILEWAYEQREEEAGAAYFYLMCEPKVAADSYSDIIAFHQLYGILAGINLKQRGFDVSKLSIDTSCHPRFVYYGLRYVPGYNETKGLEVLMAHPDWLIEYLMDNPQIMNAQRRVSGTCKAAARIDMLNPLQKHLSNWMETYAEAIHNNTPFWQTT